MSTSIGDLKVNPVVTVLVIGAMICYVLVVATTGVLAVSNLIAGDLLSFMFLTIILGVLLLIAALVVKETSDKIDELK